MTPRLIFDLDDTLYPEHEFVISGFAAVDDWLLRNYGQPGFLAVATRLFREGVRRHIFDEAITCLGWSDSEIAIDAMVAIYRGHSPRIHLHEDAHWALARARKGALVGLLTDGYLETQQRKVHALGLARSFDVIVYSDEFGRDCWKPSEVPFRAVMERTGGPANWFTYVADNPSKDFETASALGWQTVRIMRADGEYRNATSVSGHEADATIETLLDLFSVINLETGKPKPDF